MHGSQYCTGTANTFSHLCADVDAELFGGFSLVLSAVKRRWSSRIISNFSLGPTESWFTPVLRIPGCLPRIPDPTFSIQIPDPGLTKIPDPHQKNVGILTRKTDTTVVLKRTSEMFIPDPGFFFIPDPGVHRIPDPDPQHRFTLRKSKE